MCGLGPGVREAFNALCLARLLPAFDSREDALRSFGRETDGAERNAKGLPGV